jgi:choline kinase
MAEVCLVTGHLQEKIRAFVETVASSLPLTFTFVENPRYAETNNLHSLWVARDQVEGSPFVVLYADILFHPAILQGCLQGPGEICLAVSREIYGETMKVVNNGELVLAVSKAISSREATGTFLGMARFSEKGGRLLFAELAGLVKQDTSARYFTAALERLIVKGFPVHCSVTSGLPWIDIDGPAEFDQAQRAMMPNIKPVSLPR